MEQVSVPAFYIVNRDLPEAEAEAVVRHLRITPCGGAIVSDLHDSSLGFVLCPQVIRVVSEADALALAMQLSEQGFTMLVIGEADFLDAVYPDGRRERIAHTC